MERSTFSRRDLLRTGGLSTAALIAGSGAIVQKQAQAAEDNPLHRDDNIIAKSINTDHEKIPTIYGRLHSRHIAFVSTIFPNVPGLRLDACSFEPGDGFLRLNLQGMAIPDDNQIVLSHRVKDVPGVIHVTKFTAEAGAIEAVGRLVVDRRMKPENISVPEKLPTPNMCWGFQKSPNFVAGGIAGPPYGEIPKQYPQWVERCFIFTDQGRTFLDKTQRQKTDELKADDPRNNPVWSQHYIGVWQRMGEEPVPTNTSHTRYVAPVIGAVSNDGKYLVALASDAPRYIAQAWHTCLHHVVRWLPTNVPPLEREWKIKLYAMTNEPIVLMTRIANDFPASMKLKENAVASP